jgi:hypothetical protein
VSYFLLNTLIKSLTIAPENGKGHGVFKIIKNPSIHILPGEAGVFILYGVFKELVGFKLHLIVISNFS